MPTIDGPTLVKRARERQDDLKVIFISGYTEDSFRQQLDSAADVRFLSKPFSLKELAAAVKQAIHGGDG
jgi:two-component system cell cycle sensor histidine kinase/response regulator CckA